MIHITIELKTRNANCEGFFEKNLSSKVNREINSVIIGSVLTLEVIYGEEERRRISVDSNVKRILRIGRQRANDIDFNFEDDDVSRKQCIIYYEDNNWYIQDGDGIKPSSNGTWFYPEKYYDILDGMIIRMGTTSFKCKYII